MGNKGLEQSQILIAESESELRVLFREYLSSIGIRTETVNSGHGAIEHFLKSKENKKAYDVVVLDTHLHGPSGLDVAKKIRSQKPDQKLVLVTTTPKENLPKECLEAARIKEEDILTMPFKLSKLVSVLKN
jgi:two-component system, OmpR family, response regulator